MGELESGRGREHLSKKLGHCKLRRFRRQEEKEGEKTRPPEEATEGWRKKPNDKPGEWDLYSRLSDESKAPTLS